jgi:pyruvate-ferredoxin/flavodoxin oxidoreductase
MLLNEATTDSTSLSKRKTITVDGNEAAAFVAYKTNEVIAIYPITPSSPMAEYADARAAHGQPNIWGTVPVIQEMQSEGGAAGAAHGALQAGALTTSFTASQGLLLMIPNMFKLAGELTSTTLHITARAVATHGLSIFCDHSDVMATRTTGWAMLFANSVQEAHDFALISQAATLKARVPFLHIFDGFRTSHEVSKIEQLNDSDMREMIDDDLVRAHRQRALSPDHPVLRGTAQNPDVFFQSRERSNPYYESTPEVVAELMRKFADLTGRRYKLFEYAGHPSATRIIVMMGSGAETAEQVVHRLVRNGERVGLIKVRLFRPFAVEHLLAALPPDVTSIAVLDRTKEPGSVGEPLFQDVVTAVHESRKSIVVIGGRYGLGSKEFTPGMCKAVFEELAKPVPRHRFTIGIKDDVTNISLDYDEHFDIEPVDTFRAIFWGLGSDGTVGANKNSIKIIGEETNLHAQGFFVYDSKKSGSITVSHLRFGPTPIHAPYLISQANFVAVHQFNLLERYAVLDAALPGATILLNTSLSPAELFSKLPRAVVQQVVEKELKLYVLDGADIAQTVGLGGRINTIMQAAFFAVSGVLPLQEALQHIKSAAKKSYAKFGEPVIRKNYAALDAAVERLQYVETSGWKARCNDVELDESDAVPKSASVVEEMIAGRGDDLPVSALPCDGTFPTGTAALEKRNIASEIPVWDPAVCIQCGKCVMVCPHAAIRSKIAKKEQFLESPKGFLTCDAAWRELQDYQFTIQVSAEDCTGCSLCAEICPIKNKANSERKALNMVQKDCINFESAKENWEHFLSIPYPKSELLTGNSVKNVQLLEPLFEFSGACAGCGETPYVKLLSQLFGDRAMIANATGCSSIYGGNLPTTPWTRNNKGQGPAWSNSLFEDNAEFGLGMRLAVNVQTSYAFRLLEDLRSTIGAELCDQIVQGYQSSKAQAQVQRGLVSLLKLTLSKLSEPKAKDLANLADLFVKRSVWIVGGDGWAYDIGYGGLDHVLASGEELNILVLDTEVYSNTGGQMSKATSRGAVAKFASSGKQTAQKDLGRLAMNYGNVYVAQVALGADDTQTLKAFIEAESYPGPSLIIAYCHCIAHGIDMTKGLNQQKLAVQSGHWPLYRFDPRRTTGGQNALQLDCKAPSIPLENYYYSEARYRMLTQSDPAAAETLLSEAKHDVQKTWQALQELAQA